MKRSEPPLWATSYFLSTGEYKFFPSTSKLYAVAGRQRCRMREKFKCAILQAQMKFCGLLQNKKLQQKKTDINNGKKNDKMGQCLKHNTHAHAVALWLGIGVVLCRSSFAHCMRSLNIKVHSLKTQWYT